MAVIDGESCYIDKPREHIGTPRKIDYEIIVPNTDTRVKDPNVHIGQTIYVVNEDATTMTFWYYFQVLKITKSSNGEKPVTAALIKDPVQRRFKPSSAILIED